MLHMQAHVLKSGHRAHLQGGIPAVVDGLEEQLVKSKRLIWLQQFFRDLTPHLLCTVLSARGMGGPHACMKFKCIRLGAGVGGARGSARCSRYAFCSLDSSLLCKMARMLANTSAASSLLKPDPRMSSTERRSSIFILEF